MTMPNELACSSKSSDAVYYPPVPEAQRPLVAATQCASYLIFELIETRSKTTPDALALSEGTQLSYGDLARRSNQFAHYLSALGVGPDDLVALCMGRSISQICAALGVLKAGGAYVPLDPTYPPERLAFMLQDAAPRVLVTNREMAERLPSGQWRTVVFDRDLPDIEEQPRGAPPFLVTSDNLAYVVYTSGSTGKPKGVEITHQNLLNLVSWHQRSFSVTAQDRGTHLASVGFDAAVWEVWPYLAAGASVHLPEESLRYQPEALRDWLVRQRITLSFVPTLLGERLIGLSWPANTSLRALLTGADMLHHYPSSNLPFTLFNNYGPTECTVVTTSALVPADQGTSLLPPIGKPIDGTWVHILNERLQKVPVDSVGQLYIGGAGVGRGYHNNPELTAKSFIPDPFSASPGARLYRTGDLARWLPDGQISLLGRIDDQVKIRGYRVEPNEVVASIDEHPSVAVSFVLAREGSSSVKQLVAYVVPSAGQSLSGETLQRFLASRLPEYMVPEAFVFMTALPLSGSGKVDRASLPAPEEFSADSADFEKAPRLTIQERLEGILGGLLNLDHVGAEDNFFQLGGNSLLGTQVISRIRDAFGVEVPLLILFDHPTVSELSEEIEKLILEKLELDNQNAG